MASPPPSANDVNRSIFPRRPTAPTAASPAAPSADAPGRAAIAESPEDAAAHWESAAALADAVDCR
eukprot:4987281-Pyramimonas_sp.AAC.1